MDIDLETIVELYRQGKTQIEIGNHFGCSAKTIANKLKAAKEAGMHVKRGKRKIYHRHVDTHDVAELLKAGYKVSDVMRTLNISAATVYHHLDKFLEARPGDKKRKMMEAIENLKYVGEAEGGGYLYYSPVRLDEL